jgi:hypothetical protein
MRIDLRWTPLPLLALLAAGCVDIPDPKPQMDAPPDDGDSMPPDDPDDGRGDDPSDDNPSGDPPPVVSLSCVVAGQTFPDGSAVPSSDSCNSCLCNDGDVVCTDINCEPQGCDLYLEQPDGVCSRPADDPCITQDPDCTDPIPEPEPEEPACEAAGQSFPAGAEVPSGDSCNTCSCDAGNVVCTEIACDPVFCAEFVEEPDGVCARFPLDPCGFQDPECAVAPDTTEPIEPAVPTEP